MTPLVVLVTESKGILDLLAECAFTGVVVAKQNAVSVGFNELRHKSISPLSRDSVSHFLGGRLLVLGLSLGSCAVGIALELVAHMLSEGLLAVRLK